LSNTWRNRLRTSVSRRRMIVGLPCIEAVSGFSTVADAS
jgi:hypothetical protein